MAHEDRVCEVGLNPSQYCNPLVTSLLQSTNQLNGGFPHTKCDGNSGGARRSGCRRARGVSAMCPYLYHYGGIDLDSNKVGFIIVQVKNDRNILYTSPNLKMGHSSWRWIPLRVAFLTRFRQRRRKISHSHHPYLLSQQGPPPWARGPRKIYKSPSEGAVVLGEDG